MLAGNLREFDVRDGITAVAPRVKAAFQGANLPDALPPEEQRHTGAGSFVRSSTVEDDFTIAGQALVVFLDIGGIHAEGAGNCARVGFKFHGMAKVHDGDLFAGIEFLL